jgi:biotin carboxyl carrier protein
VNSNTEIETKRLSGLERTSGTTLVAPGNNGRSGTRVERTALQSDLNGLVLPSAKVPAPVRPEPSPQETNRRSRNPVAGRNTRQLFFRSVRLVLAGGLLVTAVIHIRRLQTTARSHHATINTEITPLRAPIAGELRFEKMSVGKQILAGTTVFTVANARFGNQDAMSQLNWVKELTERLQAEAVESALRFRQQEEIFEFHEKLYKERVLSRLEYVEEQTKLALARTIMTNKQAQAVQAEERRKEISAQVELQKHAVVKMPFAGVTWNVPLKNGAEVYNHETVLEVFDPSKIWVDAVFHERHSEKIAIGKRASVRTLQGKNSWHGTIEAVRGGAGRVVHDGAAAVSIDDKPLQISARLQMDEGNPFGPREFFGVGRNVIVTVDDE